MWSRAAASATSGAERRRNTPTTAGVGMTATATDASSQTHLTAEPSCQINRTSASSAARTPPVASPRRRRAANGRRAVPSRTEARRTPDRTAARHHPPAPWPSGRRCAKSNRPNRRPASIRTGMAQSTVATRAATSCAEIGMPDQATRSIRIPDWSPMASVPGSAARRTPTAPPGAARRRRRSAVSPGARRAGRTAGFANSGQRCRSGDPAAPESGRLGA